MVLKYMPPGFHEILQLLFKALSITGITTPSWLNSHTILLYKKGDPATLDNYRPIPLANALYKLWTTCIVMLASDYIESRKILSPTHERFKANRSGARAITHLGMCVEDAHTYYKDIVLCYLDLKGLSPPRTTTNMSGHYPSSAYQRTSSTSSETSIAQPSRSSSPPTATSPPSGFVEAHSRGIPYPH